MALTTIQNILNRVWNSVTDTLKVEGIAGGVPLSLTLAAGSVASGAFVAGSQVDGHSATLGLTTGTPASPTAPEDGTARTLIELEKGIKNILVLLNAKLVSGTDIGDVTVNNAAGAAAVNVQDGGNALTVDGTVTIQEPLSIDDNGASLTVDGTVIVQDGGASLTIDGSVTIQEPLSIDDNGASLTVDGAVTVSGPVNLIPATSGGLLSYRNIDLDEAGVLVKTGASQIYGWFIYNGSAAARFVRIYNHVDAPVFGDAADLIATICLPAGSAANAFSDIGIACSAGIGLRATTAVADADVGAPAGNDVVVNLWYK